MTPVAFCALFERLSLYLGGGCEINSEVDEAGKWPINVIFIVFNFFNVFIGL